MKINSNDQLDLRGSCLSNCDGKSLVYHFNLYQMDPVFKNWTLFTNNSYYFNTGLENDYFVVKKDLFSDFAYQAYWKVELSLELTTRTGEIFITSSSMNLFINFSPTNGLCDISPLTGTTSTLFTITCSNWIDNDGVISSYSYFGN
jgi:hypothetical protein